MLKQIVTFFLAGTIAFSAKAKPVTDTLVRIVIDVDRTAQTIHNIGASGCWFSEGIGKYWPTEKREKIAELLFSKSFDKYGTPKGIGLSSWRFNVGAGTFEQGDSSGITDPRKRTECFLNKDGTYDWNKQSGYQFFLKKAHQYGVGTLIAFSNSPPVQFTLNGLGYKTERDFIANLKPGSYNAYAHFLANVVKYFDQQGIHFEYVSPVNEPQWDWSNKYMHGSQEGSPWKNDDIFKITKYLNSALDSAKLSSKILVTEAGMLTYLYGGKTPASHQIRSFFDPKSPLYMGGLSHVPKLIGGHSYYTESNDSVLVSTRAILADTVKRYNIDLWQTEYSMLGDGYKQGAKGPRSAMDCALFLAKIIHTDLSAGNAAAWQFWNAYEPGSADHDTRYYLIALKPDPGFKNGEFSVTKNLWALGSYSRFVRPGMKRIITSMSSSLNVDPSKVLVTAYTDKNSKLVVVAINCGKGSVDIDLDIRHPKKRYKKLLRYLTTAGEGVDMRSSGIEPYNGRVKLPARSISTMVIDR